MGKTLDDFQPQYSCRFHPTDWWHEVGCPHQTWTNEQLQDALNKAKQSNAYLSHLLIPPEDAIAVKDVQSHSQEAA